MDGVDHDGSLRDHANSFHPGPPRIVQVGEPLIDPAYVGVGGVFGVHDNLAPRVPEPTADPEPYGSDAFQWSIVERPDRSTAELDFEQSPSDTPPRWNPGTEHTAGFEADQPGQYIFELDAPDGVHEWTLYAFPAGEGPRPRLTLDSWVDEETEEIVIESDVTVPPASATNSDDLAVVYIADDRDELDTTAIEQYGLNARVPVDALDTESARIHAAAWDGDNRSMIETAELDPAGTISFPDRPPAWATNGVIYQIFTRSWAGQRGETTMADLTAGVEYLDDLGIDMVWLTPVVPDESSARQYSPELVPTQYRRTLDGVRSGGGPHGYGTLDYFTIAPDLVPEGTEPIDAYRQFIEECHDHGIKVVFDLVISHSGRAHPFFRETIGEEANGFAHPGLRYPIVSEWDQSSSSFDWYDRLDCPRRSRGLQVEPAPHATGFFGLQSLPNWNYNNLSLREYMLAVADFWSGEVGVDGFRCDIAWGVPRSFWMELRDVVRSNDSEFLMLDETIPNDPRMSENAFDMHFDTEGFTRSTHEVASGGDPEQLVTDIERRITEGFPEQSLVLNLTENHDEPRLLNKTVLDLAAPDREAITDQEWETAARKQRLCWAAGVCLPGVPGIYYGQERQISRFGVGRHDGLGDDRGRSSDGVNPDSDVRPAGRQRAFMNWEVYSERHLDFYKRMVELYHELDVLKPDAKLYSVPTGERDVLVFGRDGSHLDELDGPKRVLVVLNFEDEPLTVSVPSWIGTTDLYSGEEVSIGEQTDDTRELELDEILVLEASEPFRGTAVSEIRMQINDSQTARFRSSTHD